MDVDPSLISLVVSRDDIAELLKLDDVIDLVIPRGSNALVSHIKANTKIPVLGHADGICHVYVDQEVDMDLAKKIVVDSKVDYPAACNALETLLVHEALVADGRAEALVGALQGAGVTVFAGPVALEKLGTKCSLSATPHGLRHEYSCLECAVEVVPSLAAGIDHIHAYGSSHTDVVLSTDQKVVDTFLASVDSACVFANCSTRFSDGFRFGLGAEVGISTGRIHARGPVGVEGLLTTRWVMTGSGQVVAKDKGVTYSHRRMSVE